MRNRSVFPCCGGNEAPRPSSRRFARLTGRSGFTLLELCTVLLIIVVMTGMLTPALQSAFLEQGMRSDTHELSLMVKTAMIQCSGQHRPYAIDFTPTSMALHPVLAKSDPVAAVDASPADESPPLEDVTATQKLDSRNKLLLPDPQKANAWLPIRDVTWIFEPGELCPASRVRLVRGSAWIEISFNALTGNPENESAYFP